MRLPRLTYANVVSTLIVFVVLFGGAAFAASKLGKNSVGTKQLKKNSVTAAKIKKNAVTAAKIRNGAVSRAKIADGAVTGAKIDLGSTGFTRKVASFQTGAQMPFGGPAILPLGTYTQNPGEDNLYVGSADVRFDAACTPPRYAQVWLLLDANPTAPGEGDVVGSLIVVDTTGGDLTIRRGFGPYAGEGSSFNAPYRTAPAAPTARSFAVYPAELECTAGGGAAVTGASVDVIATR